MSTEKKQEVFEYDDSYGSHIILTLRDSDLFVECHYADGDIAYCLFDLWDWVGRRLLWSEKGLFILAIGEKPAIEFFGMPSHVALRLAKAIGGFE